MGFNLQCQDAYETEVGYSVLLVVHSLLMKQFTVFFVHLRHFINDFIDEVFMFHQEILFALQWIGLRLVGKCTRVHCGGIGVYFPAKVCEALAALPLFFFAWEYVNFVEMAQVFHHSLFQIQDEKHFDVNATVCGQAFCSFDECN